MTPAKVVILAVAFGFAAGRLLLDIDDINEHASASFQAFAHMFVGGLFAVYGFVWFSDMELRPYWWVLWTAIGLTAVEVTAAAPKLLALMG